MLGGYLVALLVFMVCMAVASTPRPRLVPSKREQTVDRRSLRRRDVLRPKDTLVLNYATTPYHPPSASLSLTAQDGRPILLIEDFDHLLEGVSCSGSHSDSLGDAVSLTFSDDSTYTGALHEWTKLEELAVITAHAGCNLDDERGTWVVSSMLEQASDRRLTFLVEPVTMRDIIKSFGIVYNHNGANSWSSSNTKSLSPRVEHDLDDTFNFAYNPDLGQRLPLFPPNSTIDDGVSEVLVSQLTDVELDLTCVDCKFDTNVTIGMDFGVDLGDPSCIVNANESCFSFTSAAMNFTIEEFEQDISLEVFIGKEVHAGTDYKILWIPVGPALNVPSLVDLGPAIGIEVAFELDITSSINFTVGAQGRIPSGAFASVSLVNSTGNWDPAPAASGWDGSSVAQVPLHVNGGQFNISASVSLAPYVEVQFTILEVGAALRIIENMPKASVNAELQTLVNRECKPIGEDDFESFGTAFTVGSGLTLSTEAQLVLEKGNFTGSGIPDNWDWSLWSHDLPFAPALGIDQTTCFVLSGDAFSVNITNSADRATQIDAELVGLPAATGTLFAAAAAIPTWDMTKIESYYSANSALPTNVNYTQMIAATSVPANLQSAVTAAAMSATSTGGATSTQSGAPNSSVAMAPVLGRWVVWACSSIMAAAFIFV